MNQRTIGCAPRRPEVRVKIVVGEREPVAETLIADYAPIEED